MQQQQSYSLVGRKLFIAIPAYDFKVSLRLATSLAALSKMAGEHGIEISIGSICGCSVVSKARNLLVDQFLKTDCTDLLFIDADINFDPDDVLRLLAWTRDKAVVGGVPRTRKTNKVYIATLDQVDDSVTMDAMGLVRAKRIATAFMMVKRVVFEDLIAAHPEWKYKAINQLGVHPEKEDGEVLYSVFDFKSTPDGYIGEDFLFCDRVRELGHEVWIDPTIKLGHMGAIEYEGDFGNDVLYQMIIPSTISDVA